MTPAEYRRLLDTAWADHLAPRDEAAPRVVSTFAGCGGSSLGYAMAGYRELAAVEWADVPGRAFRLNFPGVPLWNADIKRLSATELMEMARVAPGELDVLDGSPPCQGFSTAGRRQLHDTRNTLFREYARLLEALRPRAFVMENVSGMVRSHMKVLFAEIMRALKACGYRVRCWLMDARWYLVPQGRRRVIFIGLRDDLGLEPTCPPPCGSQIPLRHALASFTPGGAREEAEVPTPAMDERYRKLWALVAPGEALADVRERMIGKRKGYQDVYKADPFQPSPTLTALSTGRGYATLCHPLEARSLDIGEARVIGSFPRQFQLVGDFSQRWALIGNSVPPLFMRAISRHVRALLSEASEGALP